MIHGRYCSSDTKTSQKKATRLICYSLVSRNLVDTLLEDQKINTLAIVDEEKSI